MTPDRPYRKFNRKRPAPKFSWRAFAVYFAGVLLANGLVLIHLAGERSEAKSAVLFGYSSSRLALLAVVTVVLLLTIGVAVALGRSARLRVMVTGARFGFGSLSALLFLTVTGLLLTYVFILPSAAPALTVRFLPVGVWLAFSGAWTFVWCDAFAYGNGTVTMAHVRGGLRKTLLPALLIVAALGFGYWGIARSGIGLTPDPVDWQPTGMAIHPWQLAVALWIGAFWWWLRRTNPAIAHWNARIGFLLVWIVATLLWTNVSSDDVLRNSYFMEITPPNEIPYPASDAAYFSLWAETINAGLGLKNVVVSRQLFVWVLSLIFRYSGGDPYRAIDLLTTLLALIPACFFLLGRRMFGRSAGAMMAAVMVLRELNTLYMAPLFGVSSSKMFLSDLPMLLALAILMNVIREAVRRKDVAWWAIAGGVMGLTLLIRSQAVVIVPVVVLLILIYRAPDVTMRMKWRQLGLFLLVCLAVLTPALWRSYRLTGGFMLEDSSIHGYELPRRISGDPDYLPERIAGESAEDFAERMSAEVHRLVFSRPGEVVRYVANHWTKSLIDSVMLLPVGLDSGLTWEMRSDPGYQDVPVRFRALASPVGLLLALLFALGLVGAVQRTGAFGLFPLLSCAVYLLSSALGRYSGWRFNLPADWFVTLYVCGGIGMLVSFIRSSFREEAVKKPVARDQVIVSRTGTRLRTVSAVMLCLGMVIVGGMPSWSDALMKDELTETASTPGTWQGKMLYPRWFPAHEGLTSANPWSAYRARDYDRLGFVLLGVENADVVLPIGGGLPFLENGATCSVSGSMDAEGVVIADVVTCGGNRLESNSER